jgi:hypothetical protein
MVLSTEKPSSGSKFLCSTRLSAAHSNLFGKCFVLACWKAESASFPASYSDVHYESYCDPWSRFCGSTSLGYDLQFCYRLSAAIFTLPCPISCNYSLSLAPQLRLCSSAVVISFIVYHLQPFSPQSSILSFSTDFECGQL